MKNMTSLEKTKDDGVSEQNMAYAEVIEECVGVFKRWQLMVFLLVFLVNTPLAMQELSIVFLAPHVTFNCTDPKFDPCSKDCPGRVFDESVFDNTIVSQWDLVCENDWLGEFSQTILMLGILVGNFVFGYLSDRFGRRKPLVIAIFLEVVSGVAIAFAPYFWLFLVLRFLVAVAAGGTLVTGFVIVVEIIGRKYRPTFGILFQVTYYIGHALLGAVGYFLRDWRDLQLTISLPVILLVSYYWLLPESPRWLLTVGKYDQAIKELERGARFNGMPTEHIREAVMSKAVATAPVQENLLDLVRTPNIRAKTVCILFNWALLGLVFFGVAQYMGRIAGDIFLNTALAGLIQIPGTVVILYAINKWGRKRTLIGTYACCSLACIGVIAVPGEPTYWVSIFGCLGMLTISLSFAVMFLWSGELYPTVVRNAGMGISATFAKFGSMISPFVSDLHTVKCWIPMVVYGIAPVLALLVCLRLPETLNSKMPDTAEEGEAFGKKTPEPSLST